MGPEPTQPPVVRKDTKTQLNIAGALLLILYVVIVCLGFIFSPEWDAVVTYVALVGVYFGVQALVVVLTLIASWRESLSWLSVGYISMVVAVVLNSVCLWFLFTFDVIVFVLLLV